MSWSAGSVPQCQVVSDVIIEEQLLTLSTAAPSIWIGGVFSLLTLKERFIS
jgi:hypothetical protein